MIGPGRKGKGEDTAIEIGSIPPGNPFDAIKSSRLVPFFEYLLIRGVAFSINALPFPLALRLARPLGFLLFRFLTRLRKRALDNLKQAFQGQKTDFPIQKIAQESFVYLAEFAIEWFRMSRIARNPDCYLAIRNVERIHTALKEGKGALLLVSHGGNWEIAALIAGELIAKPVGASIYALARPLKNPYLYHYVLHLRGLTGLRSIDKIGAVKETFRRLKENGIVSLLIDQRVSEGAVETEFFGQSALTTSLPALCAIRLGTPIFFLFVNRTPGLRFVMEVEGPAPIETTGKVEQDIRINTQHFNNRIETEIRKDPARWLWMHNRWRERDGAKD